MRLFYALGIRIYVFLVLIASLFNKKAKEMIIGRRGLLRRIKSEVDTNAFTIWIHTASVGEFEQGRPVIEKIKALYPDCKILLTFFSPSGYNLRKNYELADYVYYLPFDFKYSAKKFIKLVNPDLVYFVKYEYWYNYINELSKRNTPVYIISAIFRENQVFFNKIYGWWFRKILKRFNLLFVQNDESKELLNKYDIDKVIVSGDTRFDRVYEIASNADEINVVNEFKDGKDIIIAGSTWPRDEENLVKYINSDKKDFKYIIAPHEIEERKIDRLISSLNKKCIKYSDIAGDISDYDVLIINNIGLLSRLYRYGNIAYIGGGFGVGIHNILEAATFGLPVIFGPNYHKFQEAKDLIKKEAAFSINDYEGLFEILTKLTNNAEYLKTASRTASDYINESRGGSEVIVNNTISK